LNRLYIPILRVKESSDRSGHRCFSERPKEGKKEADRSNRWSYPKLCDILRVYRKASDQLSGSRKDGFDLAYLQD
jgi:hypothetical protein